MEVAGGRPMAEVMGCFGGGVWHRSISFSGVCSYSKAMGISCDGCPEVGYVVDLGTRPFFA